MPQIPKLEHAPPLISTEQMIEVDRLMIKDYGIELIQMMENAGRALAIVARDRFLTGNPKGKKVLVMAGRGGNGGGALVAARRLHSWGAQVKVCLTARPTQFNQVPAHQLRIIRGLGVELLHAEQLNELPEQDLLLDGIIGYSIKGDPRGAAKELIEWANTQSTSILSLDTPSGLNLTTGKIHTPCTKATATLTLALPKIGLYKQTTAAYVGEKYLADISVPPQLYGHLGLPLSEIEVLFAQSDIVRLD